MSSEHWQDEPDDQDYPAARCYLSLVLNPIEAKKVAKSLAKLDEVQHVDSVVSWVGARNSAAMRRALRSRRHAVDMRRSGAVSDTAEVAHGSSAFDSRQAGVAPAALGNEERWPEIMRPVNLR
jgi:hypothetical protein